MSSWYVREKKRGHWSFQKLTKSFLEPTLNSAKIWKRGTGVESEFQRFLDAGWNHAWHTDAAAAHVAKSASAKISDRSSGAKRVAFAEECTGTQGIEKEYQMQMGITDPARLTVKLGLGVYSHS